MMWWDAAHIERTVTRSYVTSRLNAENQGRLDLAPGFGDGLTDGTYWEWIADKAKRIFLILDEIGIPDQIFLVVDNSWDDDDLPLPLDQVERLTASRDTRLNRRFHDRQAYYNLREIDEGAHVVYEDDEVVPIDTVDTRHGVGLHTGSSVDKVTLPNRPGHIFARRRVSVGSAPGAASPEYILSKAQSTRDLQNGHIISYYASYTHHGSLYLLFSPASEYSLKTLLATMPAPLKALSKQDRRLRAMDWLHCLADSLCYLHGRGRAHGNIKPSNVLFDADHHPLLVDPTQLSVEGLTQAAERAAFDKESYDYAAPEQWFRPPAPTMPAAAPTSSVYMRNNSSSSSSSSTAISMGGGGGGSSSSRSAGIALPSPPPRSPPFSITRFSTMPSGAGAVPTTTTTTTTTTTPAAAMSPPHLDPQAADIFSLGCVMLEVLSGQLKRTPKAFAAHRGARHRIAGRGGAVLDTSFHKNLGQVQSWMAGLAKDAGGKKGRARADAGFFHGVAPTLAVVARMLAPAPQDRPPAREVEQLLYRVLTEHCSLAEPHCVHQYAGFDFGLGGLCLSPPPPPRRMGFGDGALHEGEEEEEEDNDYDAGSITIPTRTNKGYSGPPGLLPPGGRVTAQALRDSGYHSLPAASAMSRPRAVDTRGMKAPVYEALSLGKP